MQVDGYDEFEDFNEFEDFKEEGENINNKDWSGHKAGFVNIIGKPNAGKSTLLNALLGERLAIITSKAQTTRHRILGVLNTEESQIIFSDTPGFIKPKYALQESMMNFVNEAITDADILLFIQDLSDPRLSDDLIEKVNQNNSKKFLILNKLDAVTAEKVTEMQELLCSKIKFDFVFTVSALHNHGLEALMKTVVEELPEFPPYYDKEALTDRPERFFVSEIIREKIFLNYDQEIPYSSEVVIEEFKDKPEIITIRATILIERDSQKPIVIGKNGTKIKWVGIEARKDIEAFLGKKVYLELYVKVKPNWRKNNNILKNLGYKE